ncbi:MAG TPA: F0F1 ATP synthase subunit B' [Acetobacteraceae bacterium]|jgi:F-type H+-transporting ATPase subunit b|nr:F0F1 ATP synthase subunit B' [Acetobacteraceae bacterium]
MRPLLAASVSLGLLLPAAAMAEGMPQLDFANPLTTHQLIWGAVIFIVFYFLASRSALPKVGAVLAERAKNIARDLQNAQDAKDKSDKAAAEVAAATAKARAEAQAAINAALDKAKADAAAQAAALNERLEKQLQESEATIAAARTAAMGALREVATDTATTVITRLTGAPPEQARLNGAIGAALSARGVG